MNYECVLFAAFLAVLAVHGLLLLVFGHVVFRFPCLCIFRTRNDLIRLDSYPKYIQSSVDPQRDERSKNL